MKTTTASPPCNTCLGYGLWATGTPSPMRPEDALDGFATIPCPECGANKNPKNPKAVQKGYIRTGGVEPLL